MTSTNILLLALLGLAPSLFWLFLYLREDCEPEPKSLLLKTFLMGVIISPLAIILQFLFADFFSGLLAVDRRGLMNTGAFLFWAAFVEETIKFYAVRSVALNTPEFDEPTDGMIYMITASLGFAAMENILVAYNVLPKGISTAFSTILLRFFGATLLHTLSAAIFGYFIAIAWLFDHHRKKFILAGLALATISHFIFNLLLSSASHAQGLFFTTLLLLSMAYLVYLLFAETKRKYCKATRAA